MNSDSLRRIFFQKAIEHDLRGDKAMWLSAAFCAKVVGNYDRGATLGLADDMGRSVDTLEDRSHAYTMFQELCNMDGGEYRRFVFSARRSTYIHLSHFRALWDVRNSHNLALADCLALLIDVVQQEGSISSRNLSDHARLKFGDTRTWEYYAQKAIKEISKTLQQPDTPPDVRKVLQEAFSKLGDEA